MTCTFAKFLSNPLQRIYRFHKISTPVWSPDCWQPFHTAGFFLCARCALHIYFTKSSLLRCDVRQPTYLTRKPLGDHSMSVKSGLDSTCCQVAWRVRPYRVKPLGLNPGLWLGDAIGQNPISMGISNIMRIGNKQAH